MRDITRTRKCFAWLPTRIEGCIIWFESYLVKEVLEGHIWIEKDRHFIPVGRLGGNNKT